VSVGSEVAKVRTKRLLLFQEIIMTDNVSVVMSSDDCELKATIVSVRHLQGDRASLQLNKRRSLLERIRLALHSWRD